MPVLVQPARAHAQAPSSTSGAAAATPSSRLAATQLTTSITNQTQPTPPPELQPLPVVSKKSDHGLIAKQAARILSLEKTVSFLQEQHTSTLKGLHEEIERLHGVISGQRLELMIKIAHKGDDDKPYARGKASLVPNSEMSFGNDNRRRSSIFSGFRNLGASINLLNTSSNFGTADNSDHKLRGVEHGNNGRILAGNDIFNKMREWAHSESSAPKYNSITSAANSAIFKDGSIAKTVASVTHTSGTKELVEVNRHYIGQGVKDMHLSPAIMAGHLQLQSLSNNPGQLGTITQQTQQPMYILVERERRKYQGVIERISEESKRKQAEIDQLRSEMSLVREVLGLAGLTLDLKEFESIVQSRIPGDGVVGLPLVTLGSHIGITATSIGGSGPFPANDNFNEQALPIDIRSKAGVLPPISKNENAKAGSASSNNDSERADVFSANIPVIEIETSEIEDRFGRPSAIDATHVASVRQLQSVKDQSMSNRGASAVFPPGEDATGPGSGKIRAMRYRLRAHDGENIGSQGHEQNKQHFQGNAEGSIQEVEQDAVSAMELHNQNLDYNNRVHLYYGDMTFEPVNEEDSVESGGMAEVMPSEDDRTIKERREDVGSDTDANQTPMWRQLARGNDQGRGKHNGVLSHTISSFSGNSSLIGSDPGASKAAATSISGTYVEDARSGTAVHASTLPPLRTVKGAAASNAGFQPASDTSRRGVGSNPEARAGHNNNNNSGYAGRIARSKLVREQRERDARGRSL